MDPLSLHHVSTQQKDIISAQQEEDSPRLIAHLPASRSEESKCLMFKPQPSLWWSLQQPELTKTISTNENALNPKDTNSREGKGVPLVVQGLRIRLPVRRIWIRSLAWEDLTRHGATKPV